MRLLDHLILLRICFLVDSYTFGDEQRQHQISLLDLSYSFTARWLTIRGDSYVLCMPQQTSNKTSKSSASHQRRHKQTTTTERRSGMGRSSTHVQVLHTCRYLYTYVGISCMYMMFVYDVYDYVYDYVCLYMMHVSLILSGWVSLLPAFASCAGSVSRLFLTSRSQALPWNANAICPARCDSQQEEIRRTRHERDRLVALYIKGVRRERGGSHLTLSRQI